MLSKTRGLKVLYVDLGQERCEVVWRADLVPYLGGSGLAVALMQEEFDPKGDVLAPGQPVIFASGPMTAAYPAATKVVAMFRSPLTGGLGESHAGMGLGMAMRLTGFNAVVLKGKARRPLYLVISSGGVSLKPADPLWPLTPEETDVHLRQLEGGKGYISCLTIGAAGENLVHFANVTVDKYRHFGRLGLGAVFGSKLLKAVVLQGDIADLDISELPDYNEVYQKIYERVTETSLMDKYRGLGTAGNLLSLNELHALPTRNLQASQFEEAEEISGEAFAEHELLRKLACHGCPVGCIHLALNRTCYGPTQECKYAEVAYDHELIFALGSELGMASRQDILTLIAAVERAGLDAISTGVALGWMTEAFANRLVSERDLGCRPAFGEVRGYLDAIRGLVAQETEFYRLLAKGTEIAANQLGGREYALTLGGNEVAGYHTGYANIVGQAVGARHSHLDNAGYSFDQEGQMSLAKLAQSLLQEEVERNILTSLCICLFARKVYDFPLVEQALTAIGLSWRVEDLHELGRRVYLAKTALNRACGVRTEGRKFPRRFFTTASLNGMLNSKRTDELLRLYYDQVKLLEAGEFVFS